MAFIWQPARTSARQWRGVREFITPFTQGLNEAEPSQDTTKSADPKTLLCLPEPVNCHCPQLGKWIACIHIALILRLLGVFYWYWFSYQNLKKCFCVIWCLCFTEIAFPSSSFSHPESLEILHSTSSICNQCSFLYPPSEPSGKGTLLESCGTIPLPKYCTFVLPDMPSKCDIQLLHLWDVQALLEHHIFILQVALHVWHCTLIGQDQ